MKPSWPGGDSGYYKTLCEPQRSVLLHPSSTQTVKPLTTKPCPLPAPYLKSLPRFCSAYVSFAFPSHWDPILLIYHPLGLYLDLPDLACLAEAIPSLSSLTVDPVLHLQRLRIIYPSRVNHSLFGTSAEGHGLRPSISDLVHRGVLRGLNIETRWRMGSYFYSRDVRNLVPHALTSLTSIPS